MNSLEWKSTFVVEKVIVSPHAYTEKVKHRAVAVVVDKRRPNQVKPIYKMKRFVTRTPCAYRVKGVGWIVHPAIHDAIMKQLHNSITEQERRIVADIFGPACEYVPAPPASLTMAHLEATLRKVDGAGKEVKS